MLVSQPASRRWLAKKAAPAGGIMRPGRLRAQEATQELRSSRPGPLACFLLHRRAIVFNRESFYSLGTLSKVWRHFVSTPGEGAIGTFRVEATDRTEHHTVHRMVLRKEIHPTQDVNSAALAELKIFTLYLQIILSSLHVTEDSEDMLLLVTSSCDLEHN